MAGSAAAEPGTTTRLSVSDGEQQANGNSGGPAVSRSGRFVAFSSTATNLTAAGTNGLSNIFVRDRTAGTTTLVSGALAGASADGPSFHPDVSADGRYVSFYSTASNLVPGDTNGVADVFVRDVQAGTTARVSLGADGGQLDSQSDDPAISDDGQRVAFVTAAAAVAEDTNSAQDVFVRDRGAGTTDRASVGTDGAQLAQGGSGAVISGDGSSVAFGTRLDSYCRTLLVHDYDLGVTQTVTGGSACYGLDVDSISADGRFVGFHTATSQEKYYSAAALVADRQTQTVQTLDAQVNVQFYDVEVSDDGAQASYSLEGRLFLRRNGVAERVDVDALGQTTSGDARQLSLSGDGLFLAYSDDSSTLVPGDTNGLGDVFGYQVAPIRVRITMPQPGASVRGVVTLAASALPDSANPASVTRVQFYRDGTLLGDGVRDPSTPGRWTIQWDASQLFGTHRVGARATDSVGHDVSSYPVTVNVTGSTTLTESVAPTSVTFPTTVTVTGRLTRADGAGAAGELVYVQFKPVDRPLASVASGRTGPDGSFAATVRPDRSGSYVLYHPYSTAYAGSYSGYHAVSVATKVTAALDPVRAAAGTRPVVSGTVAPAHPGSTVALQQRKDMVWGPVASATSDSTGAYSVPTPVTGSGTYHFRVVKPADADHTTGTSGEVVFNAYRVAVTYVRADPPGDDAQHLNGEWVTLTNTGKVGVHLHTWRVSNGTRSHALPYYNLGAGAKVRVHSGSGGTNPGDIHLGLSRPLWANSGGSALLYDAHQTLVSRYGY